MKLSGYQKYPSRIRILHVAALGNVAGGGLPASWLALQSTLLAAHEGQLAVLLPETSAGFAWVQTLRDHGVETYFAANDRDVIRTIARLRPHIVHTHFVKWQISVTIGARLARARLFWHLHSGIRDQGRRRIASWLATIKYTLAKTSVERFVCVSPEIAAYLQLHGIPRSKIVETPNGVDVAHFHPPSEDERRQARTRYGFTESDRVIAFFGRDAYVKGADRLADVLRHLKVERGCDYHVLCLASSQETITMISAVARVHNLGSVADVRGVMWAADVLVLPSRVEALPFVLLEARATGLPVVATDLPGIYVFAGTPGVTLLPFATHEFTDGIEHAVHNGRQPLSPELQNRLSIETWTKRVWDLYGRVNEAAPRVRHVLHIVHHIGTYGGERLVAALAAAQRKHIDEVTIVTFADSHVDIPGVRVITISRYPTLTFIPRLIKAIRCLNPDVIHTHLAHASFWGRTAAIVARSIDRNRKSRPIVHTEHGNDFTTTLFRRFATQFLHRHTSAVTAFSASHADRITQFERIASNKVHVIPNGIELCDPTTTELNAFRSESSVNNLNGQQLNSNIREELHIGSHATVLLALARLDAVKAHDLAIEALALLPQELDAHLLLAGTGPLKIQLQALAERLNVAHRVHFLGYCSDRDSLLAGANILVNTSLNEAMPLSLIEAMCAGVPIACAPWTGASDLLSDAAAVISEDRSPQAFADALQRGLTVAYHDRALNFAPKLRDRYDLAKISSTYVDLYKRIHVNV